MNHDVCLEVINTDIESGKRDYKKRKGGNIHTDKMVGKLALENNNEVRRAINSRDNR